MFLLGGIFFKIKFDTTNSMWYICFAQQNAKSMVISRCKHNYKIVLLCKGEFCASISIEEIEHQKVSRIWKVFFKFRWHKICHFYHCFQIGRIHFTTSSSPVANFVSWKTKYLTKHNKRQNVTWAHSFLLFHKKTPWLSFGWYARLPPRTHQNIRWRYKSQKKFIAYNTPHHRTLENFDLVIRKFISHKIALSNFKPL